MLKVWILESREGLKSAGARGVPRKYWPLVSALCLITWPALEHPKAAPEPADDKRERDSKRSCCLNKKAQIPLPITNHGGLWADLRSVIGPADAHGAVGDGGASDYGRLKRSRGSYQKAN
uniref:Uncharacterized protein n=1 Tax=Steinernema glaseri TaxID=37863 RepID=A0A1I7Z4A3_9BILA